MNRKLMLVYREHTMPKNTQGVCGCGYEFENNERFMGYPDGEGFHEFVCLTCHFWNVHERR